MYYFKSLFVIVFLMAIACFSGKYFLFDAFG